MHGSGEGTKVLDHPSGRTLVFEHATFRHAENDEHRLLLYTPDGPTRDWIDQRIQALENR